MYYDFWGKANEHGHHLLVYHGIDTCAVAQEWINLHKSFINQLTDKANLSCDTLQGILLFFSALHDVGKFSTTFQSLCPDLLKKLQNRESKRNYRIRHDQLGWMLWDKVLRKHFISHLEQHSFEKNRLGALLDIFARIAFGHHGLPPKDETTGFDISFLTPDIEAAKHYVADLRSIFLPPESLEAIALWAKQSRDQRKPALTHLKTRSWQLAGMIVLSDWIASGDLFSFCDKEEPLETYYQTVQKVVSGIFLEVGLFAATPPSVAGFSYIFPGYADSPTPLQRFCDEVELSAGPQLWILEDATGAGKTEAACTLVSRMIKAGLATGTFIALPTMATSNAMYERMANVYHKLFSCDSRPSLVLNHGARHLVNTFRQSCYSDIQSIPNRDSSEDSLPRCSMWLSDSTKKSLLADVGIGTLDQVLLGALPVRFQSLRALGMSVKVLVVDEVHAYDPYMLQVFESIVAHHASLGVPLILFSATLPHAILKRLCQAFYRGAGSEVGIPEIPTNECFPLVTRIDVGGICQSNIEPRTESIRKIPVVFLESNENVFKEIVAAHEMGKCVCWIRNTIKDVVEGYEELKNALPKESLHVFHSRFTLADRLETEQRVTQIYGKDSTGAQRSGQVLIASQVVEQSLDLDFDVLISDLAPVDLMIQRAGRLHRHIRNIEGDRVHKLSEATRQSLVFYVHAPPEPEIPTDRWMSDYFPAASYVYPDTAQLWRTKEVLKREGEIRLPERARYLVEAVYGDDPLEVPEVFHESEDEASGKEAASRDHATFNTIAFNKGYTRDNQHWDSDERVPTREGDEQRIVYLARYQGGKLRPFALGEYGWDLSSVKMRKEAVKGVASCADEIKEAIASFLDHKWVDSNALILVVEEEPLSWDIVDENGESRFTIEYNKTLGLQINYTEK